ncbi:MAG: 50S ribosomal protein L19e [archaeon]
MKLESKKNLAARALNVGKARIIFNTQRLLEIKEAITKQDMKDLKAAGAISIKETKGRRKIVKRKTRRRAGSIKKILNTRKQDYTKLTRKLRTFLVNMKARNKITKEEIKSLRKEIRNSSFRSLNHMKERIAQMKEED